MADPNQLVLLKQGVREWNRWLNAHPDVKINLREADLSRISLRGANFRGANLRGADLSGADLSGADLSSARYEIMVMGGSIDDFLREAYLRGVDTSKAIITLRYYSQKSFKKGFYPCLSGLLLSEIICKKVHFSGTYHTLVADLSGADLSGADLSGVHLNDTNLREANLSGADLSGISQHDLFKSNIPLKDIKGFRSLTKSAPQASQSPTTTNWLSLIETYGSNILVAAATVASIIQGLDVVERRWREKKEKGKKQSTQGQASSVSSIQPAASSSPQALDTEKEITDIRLVMDDGQHHTFKCWVSDPDTLRAYIDAFSDPTSKTRPLQVTFMKREGRALVVDITEGGKDNPQLNVILGYLEADPQ